MKHYEIKTTIFLNKDVKYEDVHEFLASNVNRALFEDEVLKKLHVDKKIKPYVVGNIYPVDTQSKIYKAKQVYVLCVRSIDNDFLLRLKSVLSKSNKLDFKVLAVEFKEVKYTFIDKVYTLTPAIITVQDENNKIKCWTADHSGLDFVAKRMKENLEKKYLEFFDIKLKAPEDFIQMIEPQNRQPIVFNYKGSKLFANKFKFNVNSDEASQELIKLGFSVGILEKNSLGFGLLTRGK